MISIFVVVVAFIVLWFPKTAHTIFMSIDAYDQSIANGFTIVVIYQIVNGVAYLNAAVNVVIYATMNKTFKMAYQQLLGCKLTEQAILECVSNE